MKAGSPPTTTDYACADTRPSVVNACEIPAPMATTWLVLAHRVTGAGELQITTTIFGGPDVPTPSPSRTSAPTSTRIPPPTRTPEVCVGDCDTGGTISVAEPVRGVAIALGYLPLSACPAFDPDGDGVVRVSDLIGAVSGSLGGCVPPT